MVAAVDAARRRKACHALCALWLLAAPAAGEALRLEGARGALVAEGEPLRLALVDDEGRERMRLLPGGLAWLEPGGARHAIGRLAGAEREGDALVLRVSSKHGVKVPRAPER